MSEALLIPPQRGLTSDRLDRLSKMPERQVRLYVLPPSHYCERARWALDLVGLPYEEMRWAVGAHVPLARRIAPATTLPILDTGTGIIQGSDRILDWSGLDGGDPALERRFESTIGVLVWQYIYAAVLGDRGSGVRPMPEAASRS